MLRKDHRSLNYVTTQILSRTTYSNLYYNILLTPSHDAWGITRIYEPKFNEHKNNITISNLDDLIYIENRLNKHVDLYKIEYMIQKSWVEDLLKKSKEFYDNIKK